MIVRRLSCVLAFGLGLVPRAAAPSDATASSPVVLDLVVRDKKNVPVEDLRAEEVELYLDGAKQPFEGFRHVAIPLAGAGGVATAGAPPEADRLVVLLFPRLPGAERDLARSAAEEFLKKQLAPGMSVAVLLLGPELVPIQGFTADPAVLKDAVKRALDPAARSGDPDVRALYSLVLWLKGQPGRKTALLFASALAVPPGYEDSLSDVVSLANQHRISFYGVDPRGLDISRGGIRIDQQAGDSGATGASAGPSTELYGYGGGSRVGADLRGYGQSFGPTFQGASPEALARLARETGGVVLERTNSFSKGMRQIAEDASGYYELRYTPAAGKPEGQVRKVEVKVAREGARVQAPQQYRVGDTAAALVPAFEKELTEALAANPLPSDVAMWDRALHFGWDGKELAHVLSVAVPLEKVFLAEAPAPATGFEGSVSILARVKDASGKVVASFSQRFPLAGPTDQMARVRTLSIPFVRRVKLAPGEYTLETAAQDGSGKLTAHRTPFKVQAPQALGMSSLSLGDLLPAASGTDPDDPLTLGKQRLIPNLGQPIKAGQPAMTLYSAIYPVAGSKEPAQIAITLLLENQPANNATAVLPAPDASGKIPYATALKMDVLPPGNYRFNVGVTQGSSRAEESVAFTIVP